MRSRNYTPLIPDALLTPLTPAQAGVSLGNAQHLPGDPDLRRDERLKLNATKL